MLDLNDDPLTWVSANHLINSLKGNYDLSLVFRRKVKEEKYVLLEIGDLVKKGDIYFCLKTQKWEPVPSNNYRIGEGDLPHCRKIKI